jgi:tetratricopeptide (TPR) repeat protein
MKNLVCTLKIMACLWFLPTAQLQAQTDEIKSLLEQVASSRGKDKVERLNDLSKKFSGIDPEKGIVFGRQALWLADSLKLTSEKCRIYNNLGINYLMISNLDSAMSFFHKGLNLATLYHDSLQLGMALIGTGVIFEKNGDFDSALIAFHKALNIYRLTGNSERTGRTLENIGTIHIHRGELKTSLSFLLEAITSFEKAGSTKNLPSLYIKIGRIYSETAELATAEKWFEKGKQLSLDNGNYQDAGIAINAIGIMYKNQGKDEEALNTYLEVVPIADKIRNKFLLNAVYGNIGNVYQSLGKYDMAIDFHQKALDIAMSLNNPVERAIQYVNLGNDYNSLKNYRNAMEYLEKALPVFAGTKTQSHLLNTYEAMITASNGLRNYNQSVGYYEKYVQLKDSLNTILR